MKSVRTSHLKASTGITGLDEITSDGFPRGRTVLVVGGAGSGKMKIDASVSRGSGDLCRMRQE